MFKFINKILSKNENSAAFKRSMAEKLSGKSIKYVTQRIDGADSVIGHEGAIIIKNDELLIYSSLNVVFRVKIDQMRASELFSLEGVIITGPDLTENGSERTVIAYYTYYLKPGRGL